MTIIEFSVDIRNKVLSIGNEEILLSRHNMKTKSIELTRSNPTEFFSNCETMVTAEINGPRGFAICVE